MTINQTTNTSQTNQASQQQTVRMTSQQTNNNKYQSSANNNNVKTNTVTNVSDNQKQNTISNQIQDSVNKPVVQSTNTVNNVKDNYNANYQAEKQQYAIQQSKPQGATVAPVSSNQSQTNNAGQSNSNSQSVKQSAQRTARDSTNVVNAPITDTMPKAVDNDHTPMRNIHTAQGWSNDVQTITKNSDGTYNVYFLHSVDGAANPFGTYGQDWEHVTVSKNWETFTDDGIAINSHGPAGVNDTWKSAWTGSIVGTSGSGQGTLPGIPAGAQIAYFSGLSAADGSQNIYAAYSTDGGKTFTHALNGGHPVLAWNQAGASGKKDQERDADVVWFGNKLLMYTAEGDQLGVYQSTDGVHWTKADPNGASKVLPSTFFNGLNWKDNNVPVECPQIRTMASEGSKTIQAVLFYGAKDPNGNPAQTTGTYYIVGTLDKNGLFAAEKGQTAHRLDLGSDYYGANLTQGQTNLDDPTTALLGLGWVGNWNYTSGGVYNNQNQHSYPADKSQIENHLGSYSTPRVISLLGNGKDTPYYLVSTLAYPVKVDSAAVYNVQQGKVVGKDSNYGNVYQVASETDPADQIYTIHYGSDGDTKYEGRIYINIAQGKDHVTFNYDPTNGMMMVSGKAVELDNDQTGNNASQAYSNGTQGNGNGYLVDTGMVDSHENESFKDPLNAITIVCDKTSIELFFPDGRTYTVARYATDDTQQFSLYGQATSATDRLFLTKKSVDTTDISNQAGSNMSTWCNNTNLFDPAWKYNIKWVDADGTPWGDVGHDSSDEHGPWTDIMGAYRDAAPSHGAEVKNWKVDNVQVINGVPTANVTATVVMKDGEHPNKPTTGSSTNNSNSSSTNKPAGNSSTNSGSSANDGSPNVSSKITSYVWNNNVNFVIPTADKNHNITLHVEGTYHDSQTKSSAFTEDANTVYQNAIKHIPAGFKLDGSEAMHVSTQTSVKNGVQTTTANWNIIVKMATQDTLHVDYVYNGKTVGTYDETSPLPLDNVLGIANQHIPSGYKFVKDDVAKGGSDGHFTAEVEVAPVSGNGNTSSNSHADNSSNSKPAQSGSQGGSSSTTKPSVNGSSNKPSQGSSTPVTKPSISSNSGKPAQSGSSSDSQSKPSNTLQPDEGTGTASHPYYAYHFDIKYVDPSGKVVGTKAFDGKASGALPSNLSVAGMLKDGVPSGYTATMGDCLKAASQAKATNNNGVEDFTFMVPVTTVKSSAPVTDNKPAQGSSTGEPSSKPAGNITGSTSSKPDTQPSGNSTSKPTDTTKPTTGSITSGGSSAGKPSNSQPTQSSSANGHSSQQPTNNPNNVNHDQGSTTGNQPATSTGSTTNSKPSGSNTDKPSGSTGSSNDSGSSNSTTNSKPSSSTSANEPTSMTSGSSTTGNNNGNTVDDSNGSSSVVNTSPTGSTNTSDDHQADNSSTATNGGTTATTDHVDAQDKTTSTTATKPTSSLQSMTNSATPTSSTNESLSGKPTTSTNDGKGISSSENSVATKMSSLDMTTPNAMGTAPMASTNSDNYVAPLSGTTATTDHATVSSSSSADTVKPLQVNTGNVLVQTGEEDNSLGLAAGLAATAVVAALVADSKDKKSTTRH